MDDMDKTMAPQRQHEHNYAADEVTMYRIYNVPGFRNDVLGFRLALVPEQ